MSESKKTKEQLLAEIEALKIQVAQTDKPDGATATKPERSGHITRRALSAWVAPVIITLPALGTILKPGEARAYYGGGTDDPPVISLPTVSPTKSPTVAPSPTRAPVVTPTRTGRCIVPPPTVSPTLGMAAAPDCGPSAMGFIALGSARAFAAVRC